MRSANSEAPYYAVSFIHLQLGPFVGPNLEYPNLIPSINVIDQVPHPHKPTDEITVLC